MTIQISTIKKTGLSLGAQAPIEQSETQDDVRRRSNDFPDMESGGFEGESLDDSYTQAPIDVQDDERILTHKHFGHPQDHPVALRHRKASADPLHKEEDKLIDQWKDLWDKAKKGECTPIELGTMKTIRGRLDEINGTRSDDARRILGDDQAEGTQGWPVQDLDTHRGSPMHKSLDASMMLAGQIDKAFGHDEPNYPQDEPESDGIHGSMPKPTLGEVVHDVKHSEEEGPMPEPTFGEQLDLLSTERKAVGPANQPLVPSTNLLSTTRTQGSSANKAFGTHAIPFTQGPIKSG